MMRASRALIAMQDDIAQARADPHRTLSMVVDHALEAFENAAGAVIELVEGETLRYAAASGPAAAHVGIVVQIADSLSGTCVRTGEAARCDDSEVDPRVDREGCRRVGIRSMVIVPLRVGDEVRGALKIYSALACAFDDQDIMLAQLLASPIVYGLSALDAQETNRRLAATFEQAAVGIAHVAPDGRFLRVNARFCAITGYREDQLIAGGFQQITHPDDLEADLTNVAALLAGKIATYSMEKRYIRADGGFVWVNLTVSLVCAACGQPEFFVAVAEDISARKDAEQLATCDALTGLPNRRQIEALLDGELAATARGGPGIAVAFLDLDDFKSVNDTYGHEEGDRCLAAVARTMQRELRREDVIGRLGGDEFILILKDSGRGDADVLISRLRSSVRALAAERGWFVGVSAGVVPVASGMQVPRDQLLKLADRLMYASKAEHKERHRSRPVGPLSATLEQAYTIEAADPFAHLLQTLDARTQPQPDRNAA